MANKQLTAKVRLNTTQAEQSIDRLVKKINKIDNTLNKVGSNSRVEQQLKRSETKLDGIKNKVQAWAKAQSQVTTSTKATNSVLSSVGSKLKSIAATYLGIMGTRALVDASDTITSAQNKLNYVSAQRLGKAGMNADGTYSTATLQATQDAMDKMYASSQKVRMGYGDMMSNVSKVMTLAGDAFQNSTDNAIRFQEIMAEAYAVGGASASEMSTSMYQLIQALGAGTLAGDELRSVREGAPLAYQAIEEFVQGVYNTEESLKDLGSQGKVTSDMVVSAIMNAGSEMDKAFAQTYQTFAQTWDQIKNAFLYAFAPISNMLRDMLNKAIDNGMIEKIEVFFLAVSKMIQIIMALISKAVGWIANNWSWLQYVIIGGLILMGTYFLITSGIAIASAIKSAIAWAILHWQLLLVVLAIGMVIYAFYLWQQGAIDTCNAILIVIGAIAIALGLLFGWQVALVVALLGVIFMFLEQVCGGAMWLLAALYNIASYITSFLMACIFSLLSIIQNVIAFIVNLVVGCANAIVAISHNVVAGIINVAMGLGSSIQAITTNIGIAFQNAWTWAKNTFWEFIADVLSGISKLEPVINGIAKLIGKGGVDFGGAISSARSKKSEYRSFVSVGNAFSGGMDTISYKSISDGWSKGWNTMNYASVGDAWSKGWNMSERMNLGDAYDMGAKWGAGIKDSINAWGSNKASSIHDKLSKTLSLDKVGKELGLDLTKNAGITSGNPLADALNGKGGSGFPNAKNPKYSVADAYDMPSNDDLLKGVDNIDGNIGDIADSMELTQEDLEYLRRVADMEWKKEFTTAQIHVDMSNYNTINGENDLDGIVTRLADKLSEELNVVANGVYAY